MNTDEQMQMVYKRIKQKRTLQILLFTLFLITLALIVLVSSYILGIEFKCPFHTYLGIECPACGGTRMVVSILKLDLYQAFRYNPYMFVWTPVLSIIYLNQVKKYIDDGDFSNWAVNILLIFFIGLIVFGVVRNISTFSWMKPTKI